MFSRIPNPRLNRGRIASGAGFVPNLLAGNVLSLYGDFGITLGGTLLASGTTPPAVTITGSTAQRLGLRIEIDVGGALGVATFRWSVDNGATYEETGVTTAATYALGTTGVTANFPAGTYNADNQYDATTSAWADQGFTGNDADQSTAADQPTFNSGDSDFNGHASLGFALALTQFLNCNFSANFTGVNPDFHVFLVVKLASTAAIQTALSLGNTALSDYIRWGFTTAASWQTQKFDGVNPTASATITGADTAAHVLEFSSPGTTADILEDGVGSTGLAYSTAAAIDLNGGAIGGRLVAGVVGQHLDGKLAHIEVFDKQLLAADSAQVRAWLKQRYGTP